MGGIFLSYRREDSAGWAGRLSEDLKKQFGPDSIFMDIDTIEPGTDFTEALQKAVSACDVFLAIIGPDWATVTDAAGKHRLDDPNDWVRVELATALQRKIRVIPVLVGGASVPTKDLLPDELDALALRQAHELTDKRWNYDVEQLVKALPTARQKPLPPQEATPTASRTGSLRWAMVVMLLVVAIGAWIGFNSSSSPLNDLTQTTPLHTSQVPSPPKPSANLEPVKLNPTKPSHVLHLRAGQEVRLKNKFVDYRYRVLTAELQRQNPSTNLLRLQMRFTNDGWPSANFWNDGFRLLVNGLPQAPINDLNEVIEPHSAKEGIIEFSVPEIATEVTLQMKSGEDVAEILIDLTDQSTAVKPPVAANQPTQSSPITFPISLPAGQTVQLKDHRAARVYTLLSAQVDRRSTESRFLTLKIRILNNGPLDTEFSSDNFRLFVDGVPRAPATFLNELVDQHSAKEGTVEFAYPATAEHLVLQVRVGQETADIPLDLKARPH